MPNLPDLPFGLYERLITEALARKLLACDPATTALRKVPIGHAEAHDTLARHLERVFARALRGLPEEERLGRQVELTNALLGFLGKTDETAAAEVVAMPPEELRAIQDLPGGATLAHNLPSPIVPLSASDLLVNARGEPGLAANLATEIPSADSIDLLCAFVRWHGLRVIEGPLKEHCQAGKPLRVITTVYTGSTERKALDWLAGLGADIRVSYETRSNRLHAKAWHFRRATGYSTAYVGSSNLSKAALLDGVEWNVRLSEVSSPDVLEKFAATFDTYWSSPEYESYDPARDTGRLDQALARAGGRIEVSDAAPLVLLDVTPWPHQTDMLEKLAVERKRHHRHRNLVVAATGTGKTIVAAMDYRRLRQPLDNPSLLFVAHRQEILKQSVGAFRQVLRDGAFGELYVDGHRPDEWRHVFASVQSLAKLDLSALSPAAFDVVIVDEFHHAAASTYRRLLNHLQPKELVGLTATPERADGESVLSWFDEHISVELRLWDALERGLLCPFQYFGLSDQTDLSSVKWSRRGYDVTELENLYTANDARVQLVLRQIVEKLRDPGQMRALGFCVGIAHAEFMARKFTQAGLPSEAVSADTDSETRANALRGLEQGKVRALFAVDIFNEGVDLPSVDTILFLRPTESAVVFMQQLGRGLRRTEQKDCVTVLDFIGQSHRKFRFDLRYRAITGASRTEVERQVKHNFPVLPAGCTMQLDRVAKEVVLDSLRNALPLARPAMIVELRALASSEAFTGRAPSLADFLRESGLELEDVYRRGSWSQIRRAAGLETSSPGPNEEKMGKRINGLLHTDDDLRFRTFAKALESPSLTHLTDSERRLLTGLHYALIDKAAEASSLDDSLLQLHRHPALVAELRELLSLLTERAAHLTWPLDDELGWEHQVPLSVHAQYSTREILAAFGQLEVGRTRWIQSGVFRDDVTNTDFFLITLEKSERDYSPSTLYQDYAISPTRFHWESQSTQTVEGAAGQRYIRHQELGGNVMLFVRLRKRVDGRAAPYTFLGPADYVSHQKERPIQIIWELRRPMPADLFREAKVVAA